MSIKYYYQVLNVAKKYNTTPVQILLNWGLSRGYSIIPKSARPERIKANLTIIKLDQKDIDEITNIGKESTIRVW